MRLVLIVLIVMSLISSESPRPGCSKEMMNDRFYDRKNLAGLMMLTSLFVISVKSYRCHADFTPASRWCWCLFSPPFVPVRRRATADLVRQRLYHQVLLVPLIMTYAARNIPQNIPKKRYSVRQ